MKKKPLYSLALLTGILLLPWVAVAQDIEDQLVSLENTEGQQVDKYNEPFTGSLFLSPDDISKIRQAMIPKPPGQPKDTSTAEKQAPIIQQKRMITLAGVIYRDPKDWVVWLNGKKVIPDKLLPEIKGIEVEKDRVHLKWFDNGLNKVISITMRPHQKYNIVTGVLLPG